MSGKLPNFSVPGFLNLKRDSRFAALWIIFGTKEKIQNCSGLFISFVQELQMETIPGLYNVF